MSFVKFIRAVKIEKLVEYLTRKMEWNICEAGYRSLKVNKIYKVYGSQTGVNELASMFVYPPEIKERIFHDSFKRLAYMPTLTAKSIPIW
jgi:hypothetical protein